MSGTHAEDLPAALDGRDPARPVILLAHDPSTFKEAARRGVDLQLSGHTHGGQIFPFGLLVRLVIPFVAGLYERHGSLLYVSRGTGFWGPPMRLLAPAEITELVLRRLLPMAREGLSRWEVDSGDADRLLEIIERRCVDGINGASWQAAAFHKLYDRLDRADALREMTVRYRDHMHSNEPVHTWPLPT